MRSWLKLASVAGAALCASTAIAADHRDGDVIKDNPAGDINDVYAFMDGADTVVLAMTTEPFAAAGTQYSDAVQYVFHVGAHPAFGEPPTKTTDIICTFEGGTTATCWVGEDGPTITGDASAPAGITNEDSSIRMFAGLRGDPFYFYLDGFNAARAFVVANAGALTLSASGCPTIDGVTSGQVVGRLTGAVDTAGNPANPPVNVNNFEAANTLVLVMAIDRSLLVEGTGNHLSVWASTHAAP